MQKEVKKSWALFIGIGVMMIAHGLQMQIMGIRSVLEDFSVFTTGIFMSGYYVGYFVGSRSTPNFVSKVGHIRVFAAFASLASLSALVAVVYVNPFMWTISRFITGISLVSCYVVTESWLNDRATNKNRGQLLSAYMMVIYFGLACNANIARYAKSTDLVPAAVIGKSCVAIFAFFFVKDFALVGNDLFYIPLMCVMCVAIPFVLVTIAPRFITAAEVNLFFLLETILGPIWVWMVIKEQPSTRLSMEVSSSLLR